MSSQGRCISRLFRMLLRRNVSDKTQCHPGHDPCQCCDDHSRRESLIDYHDYEEA